MDACQLDRVRRPKELTIQDAYPQFSAQGPLLNEIVPRLSRLEVIKYPPVNQYHYAHNNENSEHWDCHKAIFPPMIKTIHNARTRSFAGLHSCLNLESLSVVAYPTNQNLEELNGLARLQEFFVLPTTLKKANYHEPGLTDEAIDNFKHATGLHTLSFGFGWGAFTNLANIHQFKHLR